MVSELAWCAIAVAISWAAIELAARFICGRWEDE